MKWYILVKSTHALKSMIKIPPVQGQEVDILISHGVLLTFSHGSLAATHQFLIKNLIIQHKITILYIKHPYARLHIKLQSLMHRVQSNFKKPHKLSTTPYHLPSLKLGSCYMTYMTICHRYYKINVVVQLYTTITY